MQRQGLKRTIAVVAGAAIMLLNAPHVIARPQTLYKQQNLEIARENVERHDWAKALLNRHRSASAAVMEHDREWLEDLVPELTPGSPYGQICPACVGEGCSMGETGVLVWNLSRPDELVCRYCDTVYPNEDYPETGSMIAERMGQTFTFYLRPEQIANPGDTEGEHAFRWASWPINVSFSGLLRHHQASWVAARAIDLAKVYALTGEVEYAERCAWVLDEIARKFPNWLYHSYYGSFADMPPGEATAAMGGQSPQGVFDDPSVIATPFPDNPRSARLWGFWGDGRLHPSACTEGGFLLNATIAYDLIRDATFADGTPVLTAEMEERIVNDLILAGAADLENYDAINNKCGPGRALSAACGILFDQPERVRRGLEGFERLMEQAFHFDGFCRESPSYSSMHLGLLGDIPDILLGYTDPEGYVDAEGTRFDDLNPYVDMPRYRLALLSMVRMMRPDRHYPTIGNTHYTAQLSSHWAEILAAHYGAAYAGLLEIAQGRPLSDAGSEYALWWRDPDLTADGDESALPLRTEYFPGWQVAVLRNGDPGGDTALYFAGYAYHGHRHMDTLGISYFALGREMMSDRGYIWDDPRNAWTRSTMAHNIVTVDRQDQLTRDRTSTLELFATAPEIELVQSSSTGAYDQCSQYRRTVALVQLPDGGSYAADIFRVTGGSEHHYGLHCNGDGFEAPDLALAHEDGMITVGNLQWGVTNLQVAHPEEPWRVRWTDEEVSLEALSASPIDRLIIGDAPGWRTHRGHHLNAPPITQILAERSGEDLDSMFATIIAPWRGGDSPIISVREVRPDEAESGAVAVVVQMADRTDWIISALDDEPRRYEEIEMSGRFGFVSLRPDGSVRALYLHEGTTLRVGDEAIALDRARVTRAVTAVDGRTITLAEALPEGLTPAGACVRGAGTGWEIESVEGNTITVRDYPVIEMDEIVIAMQASRIAR